MKLIIASIAVVGVAVFLYTVPPRIAGERPSQTFEEAHAGMAPPSQESQRTLRLREDVDSDPTNENARLALAAALMAERELRGEDASGALLEAVDHLRHVLEVSPDNRAALLMLADISFDQLLFPEAKRYYERVLSIEYDTEVERRFAMTLSFLGETDDALEILDRQLEQNPESFELHSFKGLSLARAARDEEAAIALRKALGFAPSDEARIRIGAFLDMVSRRTSEREQVPPQQRADAQTRGEDRSSAAVEGIGELERYLVSNEVTAPKLVGVERDGSTVKITLRDFPMEHMPEFARERFFGSLTAAARSDSIEIIELYEAHDGSLLERIVVDDAGQ